MNNLTANYNRGTEENNMKEKKKKNYINSHVQMQIAVHISIAWLICFCDPNKNCKIKCQSILQLRRLQHMTLKSTIPINTDGIEHNMKGSALYQYTCSVTS